MCRSCSLSPVAPKKDLVQRVDSLSDLVLSSCLGNVGKSTRRAKLSQCDRRGLSGERYGSLSSPKLPVPKQREGTMGRVGPTVWYVLLISYVTLYDLSGFQTVYWFVKVFFFLKPLTVK